MLLTADVIFYVWLFIGFRYLFYVFIYWALAANSLGYIGSPGRVREYWTEKGVEGSELWVNPLAPEFSLKF